MREERMQWHPFLDWFDVRAGDVRYAADGRQALEEGPGGVRLTVEGPEKVAPFFRRERPWEALMLAHFCILHDEGRYRMWYNAWPDPDDPNVPSDLPLGADHCPAYVCYAESDDGINWNRPELGLCSYGGSTANNILFPAGYFRLNSLIRDPHAPEEERYKAIDTEGDWKLDGRPASNRQVRDFRHSLWKSKDMTEQQRARLEVTYLLRGATSPDGLHWTRLETPLGLDPVGFDTQNVLAYDSEDNRYLAYVRGHLNRRRLVSLCVSSDFQRGWSEAQPVMMTDAHDPPDDGIYTPGYCRYPGGTHHLMFPSIFHHASDTMDIQLAVSRDGANWHRPQRHPIVDCAAGNSGGERAFGMLMAAPGLLPLLGDRWGLGYAAYGRKHNQWDWDHYRPGGGADGEYWWAIWRPHRLMGLEAPDSGHFTLAQRVCTGERLLVNFKTQPGGWLRFELAQEVRGLGIPEQAPPLPNHSFERCEPLQGDSLSSPVTWQGTSDLSGLKGARLTVRVRMFRAKLFAFAI